MLKRPKLIAGEMVVDILRYLLYVTQTGYVADEGVYLVGGVVKERHGYSSNSALETSCRANSVIVAELPPICQLITSSFFRRRYSL